MTAFSVCISQLCMSPLQVLHEDILPALEKLRKEKGQYMEWQAADAKLGHLKRFCAAYRYQEAQRYGQQHILALV
jgi:chromosome segregation ATPase